MRDNLYGGGIGAPYTWIFGSSRSGSTWMLKMLGCVEGAAAIDDPHIGHHLGVWRPIPLAWAVADQDPELDTLDRFKADQESYFFNEEYREVWEPALRELVRSRFEAQAERQANGSPPRAIFVKEPGSQAADLLVDLIPDSRLIFLLRDGRDVVASWMAAYQDGSWAIDEGAFPVADWGRVPLVRWLSTVWAYRTKLVRSVYDRLPDERRTLLRYEQVLEDPAQALRSACEVAGLSPADAELERIAKEHAIERVAEHEKGPDKAVRRGSSGNWREELSEEEQAVAVSIMGEALAQAGYEVEDGEDRVHALV